MNFFISPLMRQIDRLREKRRWKLNVQKQRPCPYYGRPHIPHTSALLSGGLVKLQDLITRFPNHAHNPNLLYLISSALPPNHDLIIASAQKAGIPVILNQNGVAYPAWHGSGWEITNKRLASVYTAADYIIFQSSFCKMAAEKYLGITTTPHRILHNPVNMDKFHPLQKRHAPPAPINLLIAGSHHYFYRIKTAIETLSHVARDDNVAYQLTIAGKYSWQETEQQCINDILSFAEQCGVADRTRLIGPYTQDQAVHIFQQSDILIHPTYNDACPRLVIEAIACGVPVVFSATGGTPELVAEGTGIGIPGPLDWETIHPPSPEKMAQGVRAIVTDLHLCKQKARQHARNHFSVDAWLNAHEEIFSSLLASQQTTL